MDAALLHLSEFFIRLNRFNSILKRSFSCPDYGVHYNLTGFNLILEAGLGPKLARIALFHHCTNFEELTLPELIVSLANETVNGRAATHLEQALIEKLKGHKK